MKISNQLIDLADSIHANMMAANAIESTAPQWGVYGHLSNALKETLAIIAGDKDEAGYIYEMIIDSGESPRVVLTEGEGAFFEVAK